MVAQLSRHLAVLEVRVADDGDPDLGVPLADALRIAPGWIDTYRDLTIAQSGTAPPGMPGAFVLQYLIDPLASVIATAAAVTPFVLAAEAGLWSIGLDPTYLYPVAVQVRPGDHRRVDEPAERLAQAREGYVATAGRIATELPTPTRMSSRQRLGMVEDMWRIALAKVAGDPPPDRRSCCLIYSLPGCVPCAGCPRLR
ncbi:(2Fe-2S)-binding protein [Janibacter sp. YB324]|uniref:(2Fe-2S)-binding protein n=1 Tax=Janibacter sp. YB324 TaxID=2761047 RepID=UPI001629E864|nr:(2Fe-2S)-binding protein [Janibacter sp. YB324]QNF93680.1 (2Fe-2S)-binding protein [Janibacter sp. YB324]